MNTCPFCESFEHKTRIHYEDALFWGRFDDYPVSPGHMIIVPKRHVTDLHELHADEWAQLRDTIKKALHLIETTDLRAIYSEQIKMAITENSVWFSTHALHHPRIGTKPDAYNHGVNDGRAAGRTVDHLHWHIIPRYEGDMEDPRGGVRHVIPTMGNYKVRPE